MHLTLREITQDTVRDIIALTVRPEQRNYVPSNAVSIAAGAQPPAGLY